MNQVVSVIMNCYNGEEFLHEAIDSLLAQTYREWELIFWDNQSSDRSAEIFKSYNDERLKYFYAQEHTSLHEARKKAVECSSGKFLAFLDVDDYWLPRKLDEQIPLFVDDRVGLVYSNFFWKDEVNQREFLAHKDLLPSGFILNKLLLKYRVGLLTIVVRRSAYRSLPYGFNPKYSIVGDFDLVMRLAVNFKFGYIQNPLAYCRWHGGNLQFTQKDKYIDQLSDWVLSMGKNKSFSQEKEFNVFANNVKTMKIIHSIRQGSYANLLSNILNINGIKNKIKIIISIIIPKKLLNSNRP